MSRGITNNNPLNIRLSPDHFHGEIIPSHDKSFKQFTSALFGIRAGAKILCNYYKLHQLSTIAQIVSRFAPTNENDTTNYIADVCKHMDVQPDDELDVPEPETLAALVKAIIWHENGQQPYSDQEVAEAISLLETHIS